MRISNLIICGVLAFAILSCNERTVQKEADATNIANQNKIDTTNCAECLKYELKYPEYYPGVSDSLPNEYIDADWMSTYASYFLDSMKDPYKYVVFSVCYIDNDDIPEICLGQECRSGEVVFLTQHNGVVYSDCYNSWSNFSQYIEKKGLIRNSVIGGNTCGDIIVKLENGNFQYLLYIESGFYSSPIESYSIQEVHDNRTNKIVADTLYGKDAFIKRGKLINDAIEREYSSKGTSIAIFDSAQGVYSTKTLCELFCGGK